MTVLETTEVTEKVTHSDYEDLDFSKLGIFDTPPESGNFTIIPNNLIDIAPLLEPIEFKTLIMIYRQLYGFGKKYFGYLAISRLAELTNQCRNSIKTALEGLEKKKLIKVIHTTQNNIQKVYIFLINKQTSILLDDLASGKTSIEKITGKKLTLIDSIIARLKGDKKEVVSQDMTAKESNNDSVGGQNMTSPISNNDHNKQTPKENNLKKPVNKENVACSIKNNDNEKEIINLLAEAKYNNQNINFNLQVAESLIKKYPVINNKNLIDVVKEKIYFLKYETIDLNKYRASSVLYKMIEQDRQAPNKYIESKNKENSKSEANKWLPILAIIGEIVINTSADNAKIIIRQKMSKLIDSNLKIDKIKLAESIIKMVDMTKMSLLDLTGFGDNRKLQVRNNINELLKSGDINCNNQILQLIMIDSKIENTVKDIKTEIKAKSSVMNLLDKLCEKLTIPSENNVFA